MNTNICNYKDFINSITSKSDIANLTVKLGLASQAVVKTNDYFYKIYKIDYQHKIFYTDIIKELANIYTGLGLHWRIYIYNTNEYLYLIQEREKLQVCDSNIDFKEIMFSMKDILLKLENRLNLNLVTLQLKEHFPNLKCIKLLRNCINKHKDYALFNNKYILLDDTDWFLALIDEDDNWIRSDAKCYDISYKGHDVIFAPDDMSKVDLCGLLEAPIYRWNIFSYGSCANSINYYVKTTKHKMLENNLQFFLGKNISDFYIQDNTNKNLLNL